MKLLACGLISLVLFASMQRLDAGVCVKPAPPGSTSVAPPPSLSTSNRPTPTDDDGSEESSISPTDQTPDGDPNSSAPPTTSDDIPTGNPETSTLATSTGLPSSPTPTPSQSTSEKPSTAAPGTSSPGTTISTSTTTDIEVDADTMCRNHPGVQYLPHPYNCHKFIQCSNGIGYIQSCPSNLYWNSRTLTCEATCA